MLHMAVWNIEWKKLVSKNVLNGAFQILHDTPARQEDYTTVRLSSYMEKLKVQCNQLNCANNLEEKDYIEYIEQAEAKNNMPLVIEGLRL